MKILALEKEMPGFTNEDYYPHLKAEAARVWELYQAGIFREMFFRADDHTAILMMECNSVEDARRILETLPLVEAGLVDFEVMALAPYDGFSRLFGDKNKTRPLSPPQ